MKFEGFMGQAPALHAGGLYILGGGNEAMGPCLVLKTWPGPMGIMVKVLWGGCITNIPRDTYEWESLDDPP